MAGKSTRSGKQGRSPKIFARDLTVSYLREVMKLSYFSKGPQMAKELLNNNGIHLIILKHLDKTYLDGASFYSPSGNPVIGMTLRFDRLDNFWFTLSHELAHIYLHLGEGNIAFFDDIEGMTSEADHSHEIEANEFTRAVLIHEEDWNGASVELLQTTDEGPLRRFADQHRINPAIVAGRVRWESNDYTRFSELIGNREVREQFVDYG